MECKKLLVQVVFVAAFLVAVSTASTLRKHYNFADDSCAGRCNETGTIPGGCQCNTACVRFNDCCEDYYTLCLPQSGSCVGRCDQVGTEPGTCQCNKPCMDFGDCCPDYSDVCVPSGGVSDQDLETLSEELIGLDTLNNAAQYVSWDLQGKTTSGANQDVSPNPLLTVAPGAYLLDTISKLRALYDNYVPSTNSAESVTPEEEAENNAFIDALFNTPIMQKAQDFLASNGLPNGREDFYTLWFQLFSRGNGVLSSSGIEHILLGESKNNAVSGFHGWGYFANEEAAGRLNYYGYMEHVDLGDKGSIIEHQFYWNGEKKSVSSMFIGTSPELELALYTVCFHARPDAKCPVSLVGNKVKIQTYTIGSSGQHVGSAYPDLSN